MIPIPKWLLVTFILLAIFRPAGGWAEPLDDWHVRNPLTLENSLRVSYGNGMFLAVGEGGALYTSSDGVTWTARNSGTGHLLYDAAYGKNAFLAVGGSGTILSSPDGVTWSWQSSGTTEHLSGVAYGNDIFVTVGDNGTILTSSDGAAWTARSSGTRHWLKKVAWGNHTFVAVGVSGTILASPDGAVWTAEDSGTSGHLDGIAHGVKTFVAVGDTILTSPDGATWTERTARTLPRIFGIAQGSGTFAAVADNGTILTSSDGAVWTQRSSGTHATLLAVAHGEKSFVAAGENGTLVQSDSNPVPRISISASSLDFGAVNVGDSSSQTLTVTNAGSADLIIRQLTIDGTNLPDFTTQNNNCGGATLPPTQNCTVQIVFSPVSTGSKNATLSISSNDPNTPTQTVSLSGNSGGISVSSTGTGCFISVMACGSGLEKYMDTLRKFRDVLLGKSKPGKKVVELYYQYSPALARLISRHEVLREFARAGLVPLVGIAYMALHTSPAARAFLLALMVAWMTARWILRRKARGSRETRMGGIPVEEGG